ncbi:MAG: hypothetical protein MHM6MM_000128 [Cercozoa sp. M6MM]
MLLRCLALGTVACVPLAHAQAAGDPQLNTGPLSLTLGAINVTTPSYPYGYYGYAIVTVDTASQDDPDPAYGYSEAEKANCHFNNTAKIDHVDISTDSGVTWTPVYREFHAKRLGTYDDGTYALKVHVSGCVGNVKLRVHTEVVALKVGAGSTYDPIDEWRYSTDRSLFCYGVSQSVEQSEDAFNTAPQLASPPGAKSTASSTKLDVEWDPLPDPLVACPQLSSDAVSVNSYVVVVTEAPNYATLTRGEPGDFDNVIYRVVSADDELSISLLNIDGIISGRHYIADVIAHPLSRGAITLDYVKEYYSRGLQTKLKYSYAASVPAQVSVKTPLRTPPTDYSAWRQSPPEGGVQGIMMRFKFFGSERMLVHVRHETLTQYLHYYFVTVPKVDEDYPGFLKIELPPETDIAAEMSSGVQTTFQVSPGMTFGVGVSGFPDYMNDTGNLGTFYDTLELKGLTSGMTSGMRILSCPQMPNPDAVTIDLDRDLSNGRLNIDINMNGPVASGSSFEWGIEHSGKKDFVITVSYPRSSSTYDVFVFESDETQFTTEQHVMFQSPNTRDFVEYHFLARSMSCESAPIRILSTSLLMMPPPYCSRLNLTSHYCEWDVTEPDMMLESFAATNTQIKWSFDAGATDDSQKYDFDWTTKVFNMEGKGKDALRFHIKYPELEDWITMPPAGIAEVSERHFNELFFRDSKGIVSATPNVFSVELSEATAEMLKQYSTFDTTLELGAVRLFPPNYVKSRTVPNKYDTNMPVACNFSASAEFPVKYLICHVDALISNMTANQLKWVTSGHWGAEVEVIVRDCGGPGQYCTAFSRTISDTVKFGTPTLHQANVQFNRNWCTLTMFYDEAANPTTVDCTPSPPRLTDVAMEHARDVKFELYMRDPLSGEEYHVNLTTLMYDKTTSGVEAQQTFVVDDVSIGLEFEQIRRMALIADNPNIEGVIPIEMVLLMRVRSNDGDFSNTVVAADNIHLQISNVEVEPEPQAREPYGSTGPSIWVKILLMCGFVFLGVSSLACFVYNTRKRHKREERENSVAAAADRAARKVRRKVVRNNFVDDPIDNSLNSESIDVHTVDLGGDITGVLEVRRDSESSRRPITAGTDDELNGISLPPV